MNIDYSVIGTHPEVEADRDLLPNLMEAYVAEGQYEVAHTIVMMAEHFYGLTVLNADDDVMVLIDQIRAMDQDLAVR